METARLASQNPLRLVSYLLVEFRRLQCVEQVYENLGETSFLDVSSDQNSIQQWAELGLTEHERPYLLKFNGGNCSGEMELIFRDGRLVQGGLLLVGGLSQTSFLQRLYETVRAIIGLHFSVIELSPIHVMFSDNVVNGYLHTIAGVSLAFRIAELKWCEAMYGPLDTTRTAPES